MIEFKNVSKAYYVKRNKSKAQIVLDDVSLKIEKNEFVCLLGPSGCGKTTILNLIAGFERPTLGEVLLDDVPITKPSPDKGVVFQEYSLFPWMSAINNVVLALECVGIPEKEGKIRAMEALKEVNMDRSADMRPNILSGGMKQRVAIARILALDPPLMLMDEPFSALDEHTREELDNDIKRIWRDKKKTVVFVTHIIDEAITLATRIIMLSDAPGKIVKEWRIGPDVKRDLTSPEMIELKKDLLSTLLSCSTCQCWKKE